ncbi:TatD DNase, partial [Podila minutissima]
MSLPKLIDIGINLTDPMFRGVYRGKRLHADDFVQVMQRARSAGVHQMIITAGNLKDCRRAFDLARKDDYDRLFFCPKETQIKYFERQFELAEMTGLPMFLHDRNTGGDFARMIEQHRKRFNMGV